MGKRRHCQNCEREFGTKVEPGEFCFNPILRRADVAQLCVDCLKEVPEITKMDLRTRPAFFAANAIKKARGTINPKDAGVKFDDHVRVINTGGFDLSRV